MRPGHVLVDGRRIKDMKIAQQPIIKGDAKSLTIAAASILAKTVRDALMYNLDAKHPGYGFAKQGLSRAGAPCCSEGAGCMFHSSHLIRAGAVYPWPSPAAAMALDEPSKSP